MKKKKEEGKCACDWCGKKNDKGCFFKGGKGRICFGYESKYDLREHEFDICDDCYEKIIKKHGENKLIWGVG